MRDIFGAKRYSWGSIIFEKIYWIPRGRGTKNISLRYFGDYQRL
jgi:hypothetical protein